MQGLLKSSETGLYTLVLPDQQAYTLHFKPSASLTNLKKLNEVVVKGHLGWTPYVIEEAEIYPLNFVLPDALPDDSNIFPRSQTSQTSPKSPNPSSDSSSLPALYSSLTWEVTKTKTLIFTSGLRKIEQEGVYLESALIQDFTGEARNLFINYYTNQLTTLGFKQTLNSTEPQGTIITYAKDDLFLTFGTKNIYSGTGDNKKLTGYKAFIEHN